MAIGYQSTLTVDKLNQMLGETAVSMRDACQKAVNLWNLVAQMGSDQAAQIAALAAMSGWQDATNDPTNFWTKANNEFAVAQVYFGQIAQPANFDYDNSLSGVRGGM